MRQQDPQLVWQVLDQARGTLAHECVEEADAARDQARRKHGQSIHDWIVYWQRVRVELESQDEKIVISDKQIWLKTGQVVSTMFTEPSLIVLLLARRVPMVTNS